MMTPNLRGIVLCACLAVASPNVVAWSDTSSGWVFDIPGGGTNCDPITGPIRYNVSFEVDIRPFLQSNDPPFNALCNSCHISGSSGGLNMNVDNVRLSLLGASETGRAASGNPALLRVRPFFPLQSVLLSKINCATPPFGSQMPPGGGAPPELRALIHDWIAAGALMPEVSGADRISVGTFESIVRP
jgi:hypothetical protein